MQLSELLQWLSLGQKTGTLLIDGHGVEKRIYFQTGRINSSSSSDQREYLGHFLVSHGYITEEELKMAMEVQEESNILLGKILVMINAISETDLLPYIDRTARHLDDPWTAILDHMIEARGFAEDVYKLDLREAFRKPGDADAKKLVTTRLAAGAAFLRDLAYTAWIESAVPAPAFKATESMSNPENPNYNPATGSAPAPKKK